MDWKQITITTTSEGVEPLGAALLDVGITGFSIEDPADFQELLDGKAGHWDYIEDELMRRLDSDTTITVYVADNNQGHDTLLAVEKQLERLKALDSDKLWGELTYTIVGLDSQDWAESWKKYYKPTPVGQHLIICPSWESYEKKPDEIIVTLDPGMAFGSGTHESTQLCLTLLQEYPRPNARVLDIGCGSGILAVSALLLGGNNATGVDIDEVAVRVAQENARLNNVSEQCTFYCGNLADKATGKYDIIFANIVADVILSFLPQVVEFLAPNGVFITSGIIDTRQQEILDAASEIGLKLIKKTERGGWVGIAFSF